jgi:hypothetical protein
VHRWTVRVATHLTDALAAACRAFCLQERRVWCVGLGWLPGSVVVASCSSIGPEPPGSTTPAAAAATAAAVASAAESGLDLTRGAGAGFKCQLLLFPRNHLDFGAVVASTTLNKVWPTVPKSQSHNSILVPAYRTKWHLRAIAPTGSGLQQFRSGTGGSPQAAPRNVCLHFCWALPAVWCLLVSKACLLAVLLC